MSRGVILGEQKPRALTLYVPKGMEDRGALVGRCLVPGCGAKFYAGEENVWQKHVGDCARRHADRIEALRPSVKNKGTPFDPEVWDPQIEEYFRTVVGPRMKKEGRFEVKPNERAGFS